MKKICIILLLLCSAAFAEKPYRIMNSFNAGELTPLLSAREDLSKYQSGCSLMENMFPLPQGGAQKRPGTVYVAEVKDSNNVTRIIPFEYSTEQSYIIELGNQYMRFFTSNAAIYGTYGTEDLNDLSGSLVAHWRCNDNAASTVVMDDVGDHNGVASSNTDTFTTTDAAGTANAAFNLGDNDYFTKADHDDFSFGDGSTDSPFTFAFWAYFLTDTESGFLINKGGASDNEYNLSVVAGKLDLDFYDESEAANGARAVRSDNTVDTGWHFIVVTYSGIWDASATTADSGDKIGVRMYVDWVEVPTSIVTLTAGYVAMENLTEELAIGATAEAHSSEWDGKIDNFAIFSKELTVVEIASLTGSASTTVSEIVTPYLTADLFELKFEQSADVLYITHPDYETRKLSRLANSIWSLNVFGAENGPFRTQNTEEQAKIAASATTDSVTLTATGHAPFIAGTTAGHLPSGSVATSKAQTGALFKIVHPLDELEYDEALTDSYADDTNENASWVHCGTLYKGADWTLETRDTWSGTLEIQRNYTIGAAHGASGWEVVLEYTSPPTDDERNVSTTGTEDNDDADYRAILTAHTAGSCHVLFSTDQTEHIGIIEITAVASTTSATATVLTTLGSIDATHKWSEGSWSNYRGWPQTVTFFEDRLCFGGNTAQPDTLWGSVTADYENMTEGADDDDAIAFTLSSRQVNVIEWLIGKNKILIGTSGAEWTLSGSADEPLTPSNVKAEQQSTYGSENLQATLANESVLFFQRGAEKMRELAYNWEIDSYVAPDMTILAKEVTSDGITDTAFQQIPDSIFWCVREDGELPVFAYERKEQITAWSRMITDGDFESVAIINGDPEDEVWVIVERTIESSPVRYVEYFSARDFGSDPNDAFYVDCGITDTGGSTTVSGLDHLDGETVIVLGDGVVQTEASSGDFTVSSGDITVASGLTTVQVGLPYTVQLRTMPLSWIAQGMTIQGRIKRINEVIARWYESGDFSLGKDSSNVEAFSIDGMTTSEERKTFPAGYDRSGYVYITQESPEPLTLLALLIEFQVY